MAGPFLPGTPGTPFMFPAFQPGAFQGAVDAIADRVGEPSLRIDADVADRQVLFTAAGERVNRPTFGSGLLQLVFAPDCRARLSGASGGPRDVATPGGPAAGE